MNQYPTGERAFLAYRGKGHTFYLKLHRAGSITTDLRDRGVEVISPSSEDLFKKWTLTIETGDQAKALLDVCSDHRIGLSLGDKQYLTVLSHKATIKPIVKSEEGDGEDLPW